MAGLVPAIHVLLDLARRQIDVDARHKPGHDELKDRRRGRHVPVSPLAPKSFPTCRRSPACGSRPPRPASTTTTAPTCCWRCSTPARPWPACSPTRNARRRRWSGAAPISSTARPRALVVNSGNANAFTGKTGRQACQFTAKIAARAVGCKPADVFLASTGVIGEPLNAKAFDGVMEGMVVAAHAGAVARRRQGDHDHRHLPQGRDRQGQDRQGHRHHQRHRQGRRHDRARHGDDAVVRLHRRADRRARAADAAFAKA